MRFGRCAAGKGDGHFPHYWHLFWVKHRLLKAGGATKIVDYTDAAAMETFLSKNTGKIDCVYDKATENGREEDYVQQSMARSKATTREYVAFNGSLRMLLCHLAGKMKPHQYLVLCKHLKQNLKTIVSLLNKTGDQPHVNTFGLTDENAHAGFDRWKVKECEAKLSLR
jgi:hypothetical protein